MPIRLVRGGQVVAVKSGRRAVQAMRRRYNKRMNRKSAFAKKVLRIVRGTEETKYVANAVDANRAPLPALWYTQGTIPAVGNFYPALPALTQGTDDYQRVGNKISPKSLAVSLRIGMNATDLSANSLLVVVYYGTSRTEKTWQGQNPLPTPAILDNGDGTNSSFTATRSDLQKPMDKKLVNAKRIVFRLSKTEGIQNGDQGGAATRQGNYSTSNGMSEKNLLLKFKPPKSMVFGQATHTFPSNYAPWYAIGFCHADGTPATNAIDAELVNVNARCHLYFKDA